MFCVPLQRRVLSVLLGTCSFIAMKFVYIGFLPSIALLFFRNISLNSCLITNLQMKYFSHLLVVQWKGRTRARTKVRGSNPTDDRFLFFFFFFFFSSFLLFCLRILFFLFFYFFPQLASFSFFLHLALSLCDSPMSSNNTCASLCVMSKKRYQMNESTRINYKGDVPSAILISSNATAYFRKEWD